MMVNLMSKVKILIVEDDQEIGNLVKTALEAQGYACEWQLTAQTALEMFKLFEPQIVLLDLGLPDKDGLEVIKTIRQSKLVPIIVISARSNEEDKIDALDEGADDYLVKPFSLKELQARIRVATRRSVTLAQNPKEEQRIYVNGDLKIDYLTHQVFLKDQPIELQATAYSLLCLFAQNTSKVLTHGYILRELWEGKSLEDTTSLRVAIASLRRKIEPTAQSMKFIQTHIGVGYSFKQN